MGAGGSGLYRGSLDKVEPGINYSDSALNDTWVARFFSCVGIFVQIALKYDR